MSNRARITTRQNGMMRALLLAAGRSTRIASVTGGRPKPLLEIDGGTVLERNLRWLASSGIREIWINLHYRPEEIQRTIGDGGQYGVTVRYSFEPELLGTAGAVRKLQEVWNDTFFVVYGDNLVRFDLAGLLAAHRHQGALATIALFDRSRHVHTGIAGGRVKLNDDGRIVEFQEGAGDGYSTLVNAGVYALEPQVVSAIPSEGPSDFGRDVFPRLLQEKQELFGHLIDGYCLGLDTPESYQRAMNLIRKKEVDLA
ncbi:MAG: nucleotidyltransferase family protein [Planctomycetes bacterium]|nr:nucleotidyltransferase family protein [Planctomycetota bacterium]